MQETWGFLDNGHHDAATNMALDEMLMHWHRNGEVPTTLRFYGWTSPTLSVGYFQKTEKTIDFQAMELHQCEFVRRITGGSAVLHDDELTYSIVISENHPQIPKSVQKAYYILSKGIVEGYRQLGIHPQYAFPEKIRGKKGSAVCFEEPAYYEMVVDGKKISGNAQTRKNGVLLQHGSIPMSIDEKMLFDLFLYPSERVKQRQQMAFANKATTINQITNRKHTYEGLKKAFFTGFEKGLNITLEPYSLSQEQWEQVKRLAREKYVHNTHIKSRVQQNEQLDQKMIN